MMTKAIWAITNLVSIIFGRLDVSGVCYPYSVPKRRYCSRT